MAEEVLKKDTKSVGVAIIGIQYIPTYMSGCYGRNNFLTGRGRGICNTHFVLFSSL